MFSIRKRPPLESFDQALTRERLIQDARIVLIDDEQPILLSELRKAGFAVDHDADGSDLRTVDSQLYDLAIVDYQGVGQNLGPYQGLEIMRHIRRVSPRTRLIAYTSRSLNANESDFYRLSSTVLPKDFGVGESLAVIEGELRKSFEKSHLLEALFAKLEMSDEKTRERARNALLDALSKSDENRFKTFLRKSAGKLAEKSVDYILARLFHA